MAKTNQIKIFAKKAYELKNADGDVFSCPHSYIGYAPAWVGENELFQLAQASGNIEEITSREAERRAVNGDTDPELDALRTRAKELNIPRASQMGKDKLLKAIAETESKLPDLLAGMDAAALRQFASSNGIDISQVSEDASTADLRTAIKDSQEG